jgi:hypothetical protein
VPFLLIYVILLSYIGLASYIIAYLEGWTLIDGFYFIMVSVLTIGFGGNQSFNIKREMCVCLSVRTSFWIFLVKIWSFW